MALFWKLVICVSVIAAYSSAQQSMDDLKPFYVGLIMECSKEFPITEGVLQQLKQRQLPDDENAKCLFACVYKRAGMMDDQGYMSIQGVHELTKKYVSDPTLMQKAMAFTEACKEVNYMEVKDGTRGCDRAGLIFKCSLEKASEVLQLNKLLALVQSWRIGMADFSQTVEI